MKNHVMLLGSFAIATIIGIFGQNMAYFLNENLIEAAPIFYLAVVTILSLVLYIIYFVLVARYYRKQRLVDMSLMTYLYVMGCFVSLLTICWSLFVLIWWWG
ncbi:hypothetical protein [Ureibacillus chungkukjangi]|uniref:Uncharacterized protein n=1 Tax=Ureibacillus chungkukjangi TaxID=1202712 RepID=A0A318TXG5_9BACL|nr:hypothetical protein [Ureibacillus chungkukjangi]PYF08447.1 hypothetical protein BJ095_102213 [Ureibacillus chungkukjangi]